MFCRCDAQKRKNDLTFTQSRPALPVAADTNGGLTNRRIDRRFEPGFGGGFAPNKRYGDEHF